MLRTGLAQPQTVVNATSFIRQISKQTVRTLDLVDIVAGGNGLGKARDRGINPNTGEIVDRPLPPN